MKAKIIEVFKSIQGEGKYAGVSQVFVRFFECNMHCVWCDTPHSIGDGVRRYIEMDVDELFEEIKKLYPGCHSVSLTGGEPLLQVEFLKLLIQKMKTAGIKTYLETNGTLPDALAKVIEDVDIVAMDIKLPSSTQCEDFWSEHKAFIETARDKNIFIKTVISSETTKDDVLRSIDLVAAIDPEIIYILQPNSLQIKNGVVKKCEDFQQQCLQKLKDVRVMPQIHRFLRLR